MMYITGGLKRAVQVNKGGIATIDGERQRTWGEFAERVEKLAGALRNLGLKEGDRLAILALNSQGGWFEGLTLCSIRDITYLRVGML